MELRIIFPNHYTFNLWGEIAKRSRFKQELVNKLNSIRTEVRTDIYLNLDEPSLGLKLRGYENNLELKVRLGNCSVFILTCLIVLNSQRPLFLTDVREFGEDWKKCIISSLNKFDKQTILKILSDYTHKEYPDPRVKESISKCIQLFQKCDENLEKIIFRLEKKRKQTSLSLNDLTLDSTIVTPLRKHTLLVEQTEFESIPSLGTGKWKSICLEGGDEQTLKVAYELLLNDFVTNTMNCGNKIYRMGYPQWIASVLKPSLDSNSNSYYQQFNSTNNTNNQLS
jgi:hypothetical protein